MESKQTPKPSKQVTEARAAAQRAKLDAQAESRRLEAENSAATQRSKGNASNEIFSPDDVRWPAHLQASLGDFDRKRGLLIVKGKGSKERRIALGNKCLRNLLYYLDRHRPGEEELTEWGQCRRRSPVSLRNASSLDEKWGQLALQAYS